MRSSERRESYCRILTDIWAGIVVVVEMQERRDAGFRCVFVR